MPHSNAAVAVTLSASNAIRAARARPIAAGSSADAPPSVIKPIFVYDS
jgi:hypothetical protein